MTPDGLSFCPNRTCLSFPAGSVWTVCASMPTSRLSTDGVVDVAFQILIRAPCFLRFLQSGFDHFFNIAGREKQFQHRRDSLINPVRDGGIFQGTRTASELLFGLRYKVEKDLLQNLCFAALDKHDNHREESDDDKHAVPILRKECKNVHFCFSFRSVNQ